MKNIITLTTGAVSLSNTHKTDGGDILFNHYEPLQDPDFVNASYGQVVDALSYDGHVLDIISTDPVGQIGTTSTLLLTSSDGRHFVWAANNVVEISAELQSNLKNANLSDIDLEILSNDNNGSTIYHLTTKPSHSGDQSQNYFIERESGHEILVNHNTARIFQLDLGIGSSLDILWTDQLEGSTRNFDGVISVTKTDGTREVFRAHNNHGLPQPLVKGEVFKFRRPFGCRND